MTAPARHGRGAARIALALGAALACAVFVALGVWQVERRAWKLDLIERVDSRVQASAVDAPGPVEWPQVAAATHEYRRVRVTDIHRINAGTIERVAPGASDVRSLEALLALDARSRATAVAIVQELSQ